MSPRRSTTPERVVDLGPDQAPLVSVIIGCFNHGRYVGEAIRSALDQTYPHVEVIVIDDGSTDDSADVIAGFGHAITVRHQANSGSIDAFRHGFALSCGQIVCPLDSDDRFDPDKIRRVVERFVRNPELSQVSHHRQVVDGDGRPLRSRRPRLPEGDVSGQMLRWGRYQWVVTSCLAYPRWLLNEALAESGHWQSTAFDLYLTVAAGFLGPVGCVPAALTAYRVHGANNHADVRYQLNSRRLTIDAINEWAGRTGRTGRIVAEDDNELVLFLQFTDDPPSVGRRLRALGRSIPESIHLRRTALDAALTLLTRVVVAVSPSQGRRIVLQGPGDYVTSTVLRRPGRVRMGEQ